MQLSPEIHYVEINVIYNPEKVTANECCKDRKYFFDVLQYCLVFASASQWNSGQKFPYTELKSQRRFAFVSFTDTISQIDLVVKKGV